MNATKQSSRLLKVGLILPQSTGSLGGVTPRWTDMIAFARQAEAVGFDSLWLADVFLEKTNERESTGTWECWSLLAALAAATSTIELGPLVTCNNFRNPALLAKMAATVDEISDGRLILGLGAGGLPEEHEIFGFPWEKRYSRFEEALLIIQRLLQTGHVDFSGEHYQIHDCELTPRSSRPGGPPIMIGTIAATGPRMTRLIAEYAQLWNGWLAFEPNPEEVIARSSSILDQACSAIGRSPETLDRTVGIAIAPLGEQYIEELYGYTTHTLTGSSEEIAEELRAYATLGVSHVQIYLAPNTLASIEALAPVLAHLNKGVIRL